MRIHFIHHGKRDRRIGDPSLMTIAYDDGQDRLEAVGAILFDN